MHALLRELDNAGPHCWTHEEGWPDLAARVSSALASLGSHVFEQSRGAVGASFYRETAVECSAAPTADLQVACYRRRPVDSYYRAPSKTGLRHACGIEVGLDAYAPYLLDGELQPAVLHASFRVRGAGERVAFLRLLDDYRRPLTKLLDGHGYTMATAVPFSNVARYRGRNCLKQISLYAANEADQHNSFALFRDFAAGATLDDLAAAMVPLSMLADCTLGYAKQRADLDRLLRYQPFFH